MLLRITIAIILTAGSLNTASAEEIPPGYQAIALEQAIPAPLLYAIALTESGQRRLSQQRWRPWPWTLNVSGQGRFFASRQAAWQALQRALANDAASVDIGLMQVNWRYHQRALGSPWQSLDPYHNLRVGAAILKRCHFLRVDWWDSVGCYHAPNDPARAQQYGERVKGHWRVLNPEPREG